MSSDVSRADVCVVILTFNEEKNIAQAIESVRGWANEIFVLDSFSDDKTVEIAETLGATVFKRKFDGYGRQRNHAISALPIESEWMLFLDADEWVSSELREEISRVLASDPTENGFYCKRRLIWLGQWIKRGYYPVWILRLFRRKFSRVEERQINEHVIVEGKTGELEFDLMHEDHNDVARWIAKHDRYAAAEAELLLSGEDDNALPPRMLGSQTERKRWVRERVWKRLPPLVRPWLYFGYRTILQGGVLDGKEALAFHTLQGLWMQTLIDVKYLEMKRSGKKPK